MFIQRRVLCQMFEPSLCQEQLLLIRVSICCPEDSLMLGSAILVFMPTSIQIQALRNKLYFLWVIRINWGTIGSIVSNTEGKIHTVLKNTGCKNRRTWFSCRIWRGKPPSKILGCDVHQSDVKTMYIQNRAWIDRFSYSRQMCFIQNCACCAWRCGRHYCRVPVQSMVLSDEPYRRTLFQ